MCFFFMPMIKATGMPMTNGMCTTITYFFVPMVIATGTPMTNGMGMPMMCAFFVPMVIATGMPMANAMGVPMTMCTGTSTIGKHASGGDAHPRMMCIQG